MARADFQPERYTARTFGTVQGPFQRLIAGAEEPGPGRFNPAPQWVPGAVLGEQGTNGPIRDFAIVCRQGYRVGQGRPVKIAAVYGTNSPEYRAAQRLEGGPPLPPPPP